jgi:hypothetical protein
MTRKLQVPCDASGVVPSEIIYASRVLVINGKIRLLLLICVL